MHLCGISRGLEKLSLVTLMNIEGRSDVNLESVERLLIRGFSCYDRSSFLLLLKLTSADALISNWLNNFILEIRRNALSSLCFNHVLKSLKSPSSSRNAFNLLGGGLEMKTRKAFKRHSVETFAIKPANYSYFACKCNILMMLTECLNACHCARSNDLSSG